MSGTIHVFDFVGKPGDLPDGLCALFGSERFLQNLAIRCIRKTFGEDITQLDGNTCDWPDVLDELNSQSLFDFRARKIVLVDNADGFVKQNRSRLEDLQAAKLEAVLILIVGSWASNTCLLYTSPSPRDATLSRMPSSA